jgi:hypothetical protein
MGPHDQNGEVRKLMPRRAFKRPQKRPGNGPFFHAAVRKRMSFSAWTQVSISMSPSCNRAL